MERSVSNLAVSIHFFEGEGKTFDFRPHLGRIACPTLVVGGAKDPRCPPIFTRMDGKVWARRTNCEKCVKQVAERN